MSLLQIGPAESVLAVALALCLALLRLDGLQRRSIRTHNANATQRTQRLPRVRSCEEHCRPVPTIIRCAFLLAYCALVVSATSD